MAEPYYLTVDELRASSKIPADEEVFSDAQALELIEDAEDVIDDMLGVRPVDEETGRKVRDDEVAEWRWAKLKRATRKACEFLFEHPDWLTEQRYTSPGGDVSPSGPYGAVFPGVAMLLNESGLRELTTGTGGTRDLSESVIGNLPESD